MPNVMAAQPNIGGALGESSVILFLVSHHKVWLTAAARVPCSNAVNIGERKTWKQSEFSSWQNSVRGQEPPKMYINVPAQETSKHPAKFLRRSSPFCEDTCCLTCFFPIVDTCLSCEDIAPQTCAMMPRWRIFGDFLRPVFQRAACSKVQTCILNSH